MRACCLVGDEHDALITEEKWRALSKLALKLKRLERGQSRVLSLFTRVAHNALQRF